LKYEAYFKAYLKSIEAILDKVLPAEATPPSALCHLKLVVPISSKHSTSRLHEAMRYSVFPGGKRFRPVLTLAAAEASGGKVEQALYPAAAVELVHSYSLVHDDLPALDNDEMRRGLLTCHKQFGEAMAILTGDGLLTLAFQTLGRVTDGAKVRALLAELSTASGSCGMIGGQVADLEAGAQGLDLPMLDYISIHKTGKLIKASVVCGALAANAGKETLQHMTKYGELVGMAFQTIDDLIDGDGYIKLMKPKELRGKARDLIAQAIREIRPLGPKAQKLHRLAEFLIERIPRNHHAAVDR
jgi:geranylgeranyl diphosphate synthase type II